jgi:DNA-binding MarR family transcriptional regulator
MIAAYQPLLAPLGLTYPQYLVMLCLWEADGVTVSELGSRLHLDSGTLTPLLKRMEKDGLVVRARDREDERRVILTLGARGRKLKVRAPEVMKGLFCAIGGTSKDVEEIVRLRNSVQKLISKLESHQQNTQEESA